MCIKNVDEPRLHDRRNGRKHEKLDGRKEANVSTNVCSVCALHRKRWSPSFTRALNPVSMWRIHGKWEIWAVARAFHFDESSLHTSCMRHLQHFLLKIIFIMNEMLNTNWYQTRGVQLTHEEKTYHPNPSYRISEKFWLHLYWHGKCHVLIFKDVIFKYSELIFIIFCLITDK